MEDLVSIEKYSDLLLLQARLKLALKDIYESNKGRGRDYLSELLVNEIEKLVEQLNSDGESFGRFNYGGDINFENSEQSYSNGKGIGEGVILNFLGFTCQVSWEGKDKYQEIQACELYDS